MDANTVTSLAKATLDGSMPFPQIVGKLIEQGVEYYHVDYATNAFTFYSASGAAVTALKAAILDSHQQGQKSPGARPGHT